MTEPGGMPTHHWTENVGESVSSRNQPVPTGADKTEEPSKVKLLSPEMKGNLKTGAKIVGVLLTAPVSLPFMAGFYGAKGGAALWRGLSRDLGSKDITPSLGGVVGAVMDEYSNDKATIGKSFTLIYRAAANAVVGSRVMPEGGVSQQSIERIERFEASYANLLENKNFDSYQVVRDSLESLSSDQGIDDNELKPVLNKALASLMPHVDEDRNVKQAIVYIKMIADRREITLDEPEGSKVDVAVQRMITEAVNTSNLEMLDSIFTQEEYASKAIKEKIADGTKQIVQNAYANGSAEQKKVIKKFGKEGDSEVQKIVKAEVKALKEAEKQALGAGEGGKTRSISMANIKQVLRLEKSVDTKLEKMFKKRKEESAGKYIQGLSDEQKAAFEVKLEEWMQLGGRDQDKARWFNGILIKNEVTACLQIEDKETLIARLDGLTKEEKSAFRAEIAKRKVGLPILPENVRVKLKEDLSKLDGILLGAVKGDKGEAHRNLIDMIRSNSADNKEKINSLYVLSNKVIDSDELFSNVFKALQGEQTPIQKENLLNFCINWVKNANSVECKRAEPNLRLIGALPGNNAVIEALENRQPEVHAQIQAGDQSISGIFARVEKRELSEEEYKESARLIVSDLRQLQRALFSSISSANVLNAQSVCRDDERLFVDSIMSYTLDRMEGKTETEKENLLKFYAYVGVECARSGDFESSNCIINMLKDDKLKVVIKNLLGYPVFYSQYIFLSENNPAESIAKYEENRNKLIQEGVHIIVPLFTAKFTEAFSDGMPKVVLDQTSKKSTCNFLKLESMKGAIDSIRNSAEIQTEDVNTDIARSIMLHGLATELVKLENQIKNDNTQLGEIEKANALAKRDERKKSIEELGGSYVEAFNQGKVTLLRALTTELNTLE
ncbi:MAG: hypothetical protein JSR46_03315, partial [Verrucomicrobia bacterium]|nr:hypothetical protein [Verrucomicrobiota bacterium]